MQKSESAHAAEILQGFLFGLTETRNEEQKFSEDELAALSWAYHNAKSHLSEEQDLSFCESVIYWCDQKNESGLNFFIRIMLGHETKSD